MKYFRTAIILMVFVFSNFSAKKGYAQNDLPKQQIDLNYAVGADLSFLKMAEDSGAVFKDDGKVEPGLKIFRDHGYNWIRLRLFHDPERLPNDLEYTINLAQEAQKRGFKFLLDYHYADSWADPQKQPTPEAWKDLSDSVLVDSVYEYTKRTIAAFRKAGVMPQMVQVGNEIRNGMLWPSGKLPKHWNMFAKMLKAGIDGIDAGRGQAPRPLIMIHYDQGGNAAGTRNFYNKINSYGIDYDIIGLSYYPWWHGSLLQLRQNLLSIINNFQKDVIVVETAYNWQPSEYKNQPAPFPETPEGQHDFLNSVNQMLLNLSSSKVKGIFWWEPAVLGGLRSRGFFDENGNALPVIHVFDKYTRGKVE